MSSMEASQSLTLEDRNLLYTSQLQTRLANWMADLPPQLYNAPLRNLAIPGTHDSASFYIDRTSEISPGETGVIKLLNGLLRLIDDAIDNSNPWFGNFLEQVGKNVVYNWSVTQGLCFTEQLNNGVRYFDFRVAWKKVDKSDLFYFVHGLHGSQVEAPMQEIADWLASHPKEVVLLDFTHLFMGDKKKEPDKVVSRHRQLIDIVENKFGSMLCPPSDNVTLANLWEKQHQVIVFNSNYSDEVSKDHSWLWSEAQIVSPWPNEIEPKDGKIVKETVKRLIGFLNQEKKRDQNKFYVSQAILTPDTKTIVGNLSLKDFLANPDMPLMPEILKWLKGKRSESKSKGVNIVIADFVDLEFILDVIKLNYPA
ncbi:PI-PLC X domain-containing protein 3-like [Branchiostoma floridae x Branchiostoma japonicum]